MSPATILLPIILIILAAVLVAFVFFLAFSITLCKYFDQKLRPRPGHFVWPQPGDIAHWARGERTARAEARREARRGNAKDLSLEPNDATSGHDNARPLRVPSWKRKRDAEEERISRLPIFEQDDCGDGSNFPDVPTANVDITKMEVERYPPFRDDPPNYMQMGLKKLDMSMWLTIDKNYRQYHEARAYVLDNHKKEVLQVMRDGEEACVELLEEVTNFLVNKYPHFFEFVLREGRRWIRNKIMDEQYPIQSPYVVHPLEVCARVAMEDFNVLRKSEFTGKHKL